MPLAVALANAELPMETLPVVKLIHWYGAPARDCVYTYGRLYACSGALHLTMTVFDGQPPATQRAMALFRFEAGALLRLCFAPQGTAEAALHRSGQTQTLTAPACRFGAGADEQGWYWQADCVLDAGFLAAVGAPMPAPGVSFEGGLFLQDTLEAAFGSAFAAPAGRLPLPQDCLDRLVLTPLGL